MSEKPLFYVVLGAAGSGRREVLADLISGGLEEDAAAAALLASGEPDDPSSARLPGVMTWSRRADGSLDIRVPQGATHVFWVADGRANPVDQIEALRDWIHRAGLEVARVFCVVNCQLAERHAGLLPWYDACVHFSDIVLLNRREGVANKWMSDFRSRYKDQFMPCLFEVVKAGAVKNPVMLLEPEARRMSHVFDADEWAGISLDGVEIGIEDEEGEEKEAADEGEEGDELMPQVDPYFERRIGGRRVKEIPDIASFL